MANFPKLAALRNRALGRTPAAAANPLPIRTVTAAQNNANTTALSTALKNYVKSIRTLRNVNPFGLTRNQLINSTATNRNQVNRAIANYVMAVNKAAYLNAAARQAIPLAQRGVIPETPTANIVTAAARANTGVAQTAQELSRRNALLGQAQMPPPSLENTVKAPNGRNIAVIRNNTRSRWRFKNQANGNKYTLINTTKNRPAIEAPVTPSSLFAQSNQRAVQTPRVLGGFEGSTPGTPVEIGSVRAGERAAKNILAENLRGRNTNSLRKNLVLLKNIRRKYEPAFEPANLRTVSNAINKLAQEINSRPE
jgi:hypothetical protein